MSLDSLMQQFASIRESADNEIAGLEAEIKERQDHIKEIRALFPRVKGSKSASPPQPKPSNYVSKASALQVGEAIWANSQHLGEFAPRDLGAFLAPMKMDRIRASLERLHDIHFVRLVKPQAGPHPAIWSLYPDSSIEVLHAHFKEGE